MLKSYEANFGDVFQLPNRGLESYFGRVVAGSDREIRGTLYQSRSVTDVLDEWLNHLESGLAQSYPAILQFELDLAKKVGPLSIMKPLSERMDDIESYYEAISLPQTPISDQAVKAVLSEWASVRGLAIRNQAHTLDKMKLSTNSGSPFFTKRRLVFSDTTPLRVHIEDDNVFQELPSGVWKSAAVLGWRGQEGGPTDDDVKQRVVWMFPFGVNVCELQFYQPMIEAAQRFNLVPAWVSMDAVDRHITSLFDSKQSNEPIVCTDFTKFDQHFNPTCQAAAYQIIQGIGNADIENWLRDVFPIKYMIPLAYNYDEMCCGSHGMGSGSGGTNADETLVHRALQYEAAQQQGQRLNINSMCLGDDGILTFPHIDVDLLLKTYTSHGLEMNPDKQEVASDQCTYLRRLHLESYRIDGKCVGIYATTRALGRLMEQERWYTDWSAQDVALRQISILENVKYHPMREEFVQFCMKGDKFRLGLDIPGFFDNLVQIAESAANFTDYIGYNLSQALDGNASGIANWWIVKYLKSLA